MEALFLKAIHASHAAGWLVLAILLLRPLLKKAPKWIHCILWALVAVRLVCPFSLESSLSLIPETDSLSNLIPESVSTPKESGLSAAKPGDIVSSYVEPAGPDREKAFGEIYVAAPSSNVNMTTDGPVDTVIWQCAGSILWSIGICVMLLHALWSYRRIRQKVAPSIPASGSVMLCDYIDTPFILGILRPKIYLPSSLPADSAAHVLSHEQAHLQRRDHWWKPLGYLLLSVYWFHPLLWLAYILLCRDIELACDELVIQKMGLTERKAYTEALLSCSIPRRMISSCPLAFGEIAVKDRVDSILRYNKPGFWIMLIAIVLCIVLGVCFLTDPYTTTLSQLSDVDRQDTDSVYLSSIDGSVILAGEQELKPLWQLLDSVICNPESYREEVYQELDKFDFAGFHCLKFLQGDEEIGLLYFLSDFSAVCALDQEGVLHYYHTYRSDPMKPFFDTAVLPMTDLQVTAGPFAAADDPHAWTNGITMDAVNLAKQYVFQNGMYVVSSISQLRFQTLTEHLNALTEDAFGSEEDFGNHFLEFEGMPVEQPNVAVTMADQANRFSVSVRYYQDKEGKETVDLIIVDSLSLMEAKNVSSCSKRKWEIRDESLTGFLRELYEHPSYARERLAGYLILGTDPVTALSGNISIRLARASQWEYETIPHQEGVESFGIRCRPKEVKEGWLYFSFWPDGYDPVEEDRYYRLWSSTGTDIRDWVTSLRTSAGLRLSNDPWRTVWSYQKWCTTEGDFAIINTLAKEDFMAYEAEINVLENYCEFIGGEPVSATVP